MPSPSPKRVTMTMVAARAKVSQVAVSLALRDHPSIPESTRARIKRIAAQLGYKPDPLVSRLMARLRASRTSSGEIIAWVTTHPTRDGWRGLDASLAFYEGAVARANTLGYRLEEFWLTAPKMNGPRLSSILNARSIKGVLIPPLFKSGLKVDLDWSLFASATCGAFTLSSPRLHRASANYLGSARLAYQELVKLGYQRIGFALPAELNERTDGLWTAGVLIEQYALPKSRRIEPFLGRPWERSKASFLRWFEKSRPDAVLSFHTLAYQWMTEAGIRVPEDCGFAVLRVYEHFSGIREQRRHIGAAALDLVVEQLNSNHLGIPETPKTIIVDCLWQPQKTTRRQTGAP